MASLSSLTTGSSASDKELIAGLAMTVSIMGSFFRKKKEEEEEEQESSPIRVIQNFITSAVTYDRFKKHSKGLYERVDELIELTKPERIEPEELMPANDNVLEEQRQKEKEKFGFKFPSFLGFGRSLLLILRALRFLYRMIKRLFKSIFRVLKNIFRAIGRWLVRVLSKAVNFLKKLGGRLLNFAKRIAGRVFSYLKSSKFLSFMKNLFRGIKNAVFALGRFGTKAYNTIKNIVRAGAVLTKPALARIAQGGNQVIKRALEYIFKTGASRALAYMRPIKLLGKALGPAAVAYGVYSTYRALQRGDYVGAAGEAAFTVAAAASLPAALAIGITTSIFSAFESSTSRTNLNTLNSVNTNILNKPWSDFDKGEWLLHWGQGYNLNENFPVSSQRTRMLETGIIPNAPTEARQQSIRNNEESFRLVNEAAREISSRQGRVTDLDEAFRILGDAGLERKEIRNIANMGSEKVLQRANDIRSTSAINTPPIPPEPQSFQYNGVASKSGSMLQNYGEEPTNTFGPGLAGSSNVVLNNIFNNTKYVYVPMRYSLPG